MIDHDRALELAAAALDFGLSPDEDAGLSTHLAGWPSCRETVAGINRDAAAMRSLDRVDAPPELRDRLLDAAAAMSDSAELEAHPPQKAVLRLLPTRIPRPAALAAAAAVVIAVVAGSMFWRGEPPQDGVAVIDPSGRPVPTTSGSASSPEPSGSDEPSDDLVTAAPQLATLSADGGSDGVVDLDTSFELAALGGRSAAELAEHLTVQPKIAMSTHVEPDGRVVLTPTEPLSPGVVYRFALTAPDGTTDSWAFQARQPLRVISTLPNDSETEVPLRTGIEVTFDQDGVVDAADHFTIEPKVAGRFEQHGRVLSFVPERLRARTLYTVTISRGVAVDGTGATLEQDVRFRFETAGSGQARASRSFRFSDDLFESATRDRPIVGLWWFAESEDAKPPRSTRIDVYRFPDRAAAISAFRALRDVPRWSTWNSGDRLPKSGLTRVARVEAPLRDANGTLWTTLPEPLRAGWYLIEHPAGRTTTQAVLQVTDVSAYLAVSDRQSLVWANDLATKRPLAAAAVQADGATLGRTDATGLLKVDSPAEWRQSDTDGCATSCPPIVTVTAGAKSAFIPTTGSMGAFGEGSSIDWWGGLADPRYWLLFETDRSKYRPTDTVNAWGLVRDRETGTVPSEVEVRLVLEGDDTGTPVAITQTRPRQTGAFTASLDTRDVPMGAYRLELRVDGVELTSRYLEVGRIIKPAYRVDLTTGRRVYIAGDRIRVTATARFFEGTPVPGVPIRLDGDLTGSMTTDASGTATVRKTVRWGSEDEPRDGPRLADISAWPARAEEGDGQLGSRGYLVFPSHWMVSGEATLVGRQLRLSGSANEVDRDRLEREITDGRSMWDIDPAGKGLAGKSVRARIVESIPIRRQVGTSYDFLEKRVVPIYEYDQRTQVVTTMRLKTGVSGRFSGSVRIPDVRHSYEIELSITDPDGLRGTSTVSVYSKDDVYSADRSPSLQSTAYQNPEDRYGRSVGIGDQIDMTMHEPDASGSVGKDPHLFFASQGGIRDAIIRTSDRYVTTFPEWGAPNVVYRAIRFTGKTYVTTGPYVASFRVADRKITVKVSTDRARYGPGGTARLSVTTLGPDGRPIAASIVIRAVDEKLHAIGYAVDTDTLETLYEAVPEDLLATYATHHRPRSMADGADTAGGGDTEGLHDSILFQSAETDASGRATVEMPLPGDLTSWHVAVSAMGAGLEAGGASLLVPVGLPFFVDTSIAPEYLVADRPTIQLRAFGSGLTADSEVRFSVDAPSLGLRTAGLSRRAFTAVSLALPKLTVGRHKITITAQTGRGANLQRHVLTRSLDVVRSRLTRTRVSYSEPTSATSLSGAGGELSEVVVSDAGLGRLLPVLYRLTDANTARLEGALAKDVASELLDELVTDRTDNPVSSDFDGATYQREDGGLAVLPYASSDLEASTLAALAAPERFSGDALRTYLRDRVSAAGETRERRNLALAGLAGLGEPVLPVLSRALADPDLTIRERLMLGIAAGRLGDGGTARREAAKLAEQHGEGLGEQARLRVGADNLDATTASALMAMLLAAYGDPVAARYHAYVAATATDTATFALHDLAYARWMSERLPSSPARFAYVVDGKRTEVDLAAGNTFQLLLTTAMRRGFSIEPVDGRIGVTTTWREPIDIGAIKKDPDIKVARTVRPSGTIGQGSLVVVDLRVSFGSHAPLGCHRVVDLVPSGLVPITRLRVSYDPDNEEPVRTEVVYPEAQAGQSVVFCAEPTTRKRNVTLRYVARVISIGTYRWEPTLVESRTDPDRAAVVRAASVRIR
jgi:alpha-2-macroglobulin